MLSLALTTLNDDQKLNALKMCACNRGLSLSEEVAAYLMKHYQRDMKSLIDALDKLDKVSLAEKRRITIPFVKQVLDV
jgi:DnaA family protein